MTRTAVASSAPATSAASTRMAFSSCSTAARTSLFPAVSTSILGIEAELIRHEAVAEAAVVGVASSAGAKRPSRSSPFAMARNRRRALMDWVNARLGKTQRVSALTIVDSLPRSAIGKVLRRELRDLYAQGRARFS